MIHPETMKQIAFIYKLEQVCLCCCFLGLFRDCFFSFSVTICTSISYRFLCLRISGGGFELSFLISLSVHTAKLGTWMFP